MINVSINPIAFTIGTLSVRWYSIMIALAVVTVVSWAAWAARKAKISNDLIFTLALWGIIGGLVGARLFNILDEIGYYTQHPSAILGFQGLAIYGAILGATLALWIASKVHKFSFGTMADLVAPGALLGQAVGRVGCTINGCCYGRPTGLLWGLIYTNPNSFAPLGISTQPAVVYELLFDLALFAIIWKLRGKLHPAGSLFMLYLAMYSVGRFFIAAARDPGSQGPLFGGLMSAQVTAIAIATVVIPVMVVRMRRHAVVSATQEAGNPDDGGRLT